MNKKAQGLPINVIIVAAIALIVLVVLVAIFTGRLGIFGREVSKVGQECSDFKNSNDDAATWESRECLSTEEEKFTAIDSEQHLEQHCCLAVV